MGPVALTDNRSKAPTSVLVVEDDADCRVSLQAILEEEGFAVRCASNGAEALDVLRRTTPPDVILLDLVLPILDGWQFLRARSEANTICRIPVIALSAVSYRGAPGAEAVLPKPINSDALIGLIRQVRAGASAGTR